MSDDSNTTENNSQTAQVAASQTGILTDPVDSILCKECGATINVSGLEPFSTSQCHACNAPVVVPVKLGNFLLIRLIGTGGMGGVYFARDEQLGRDVAIKVMLQSLGDDPQFIETFRHEAQAVAKLNHANIAQIYSFGQEKGQPYIVMELVSGERVDELMERPGGLPKAQTLQIGLEIAQGLSAADEAGLVHGDIKPENILLDKKGNAKLVDFGLATVAHQNAGEGIWGTPYYIAPEKIRRQKQDARSDIYSLGATLYHMLTGQPPFDGETPVEVVKARLEMDPPDPRDLAPELPPLVSEIITRMLAVERTERYPNYRSLISDLRKAVENTQAQGASKNTAIAGGKSIRIKKKGGDAKASTGSNDDAAVPTSSGHSKKIVIRKANGNTTRMTTTGRINKPLTISPIPEISEEEKAAKKALQQAKKRKTITIIVSIIALATIAGGSYGFMRYRAQKQAERRARHDRIVATETTETNAANIEDYLKRTETILTQAQPLIESTRQIAEQMNLSTERSVITAPDAEPQPGEPAFDFMEEAAKREADSAQSPERKMVQNILGNAAELQAIVASTKDQRQQAAAQREQLKNARTLNEVLVIQQNVNVLHTLAKSAPDTAQSLVKDIQTNKTQLDAIKQKFDAAEQQRLEAERLERERQAQREAQEKAQQELQRQIEREIAQIPSMAMNVRGLLDENSFIEAHEQLKQNAGAFSTDPGKAAFQQELDRHRYLAAMKENIIKGIQKAPFPWGYGSGSTARDITGASRLGLRVQGSREMIPWNTIQPPQMLKLVDRYIGSNDLSARERTETAFGGAIYADLFGEAARERARFYATRAMDMGLKRETFEQVLESRWHATPDSAPAE